MPMTSIMISTILNTVLVIALALLYKRTNDALLINKIISVIIVVGGLVVGLIIQTMDAAIILIGVLVASILLDIGLLIMDTMRRNYEFNHRGHNTKDDE